MELSKAFLLVSVFPEAVGITEEITWQQTQRQTATQRYVLVAFISSDHPINCKCARFFPPNLPTYTSVDFCT